MDRSVKIPFIVTIIVYAILLVVLIVVCQKHPERPLSNDIQGWIMVGLFAPVMGLSFYFNFIVKRD
jgi:hypothetical protein